MTLLPASLVIVLLGIGLYFGRRIERHAVSLGGRLDRLETSLGSPR
jgi:hypothetical protein